MARKKTPARRKKSRTPEREFRISMPAIVRENPLDSMGLALAFAAASAISINALLMQGARVPTAADDAPSVNAVVSSESAASSPASPSSVTIRPEAPSMLVLEVQSELQRRGMYDGPADGLFGPKTEAAISAFEAKVGLKPTGQPNPKVLSALRAPDAPLSNSRVAAVQRVLVQRGFGPIKVDGLEGEATRAAIRRFEASRGLPQRGEISPALLAELSRVSGVAFD